MEIQLYGYVGEDLFTAKMLGVMLESAKREPVTIRVHSAGGSALEATLIYNAIQRHGNVTAVVDGLAASAASVVAMGAKVIEMAENGYMMIHRASLMTIGNASELQHDSELLRKIDSQTTQVYAKRTGLPLETVRKMLDAETWMTSKEAVQLGFADSIGQPFAGKPTIAQGQFRNTPAQLLEGSTMPAFTQRKIQMAQKKLAWRK